jgi:hypothetical protein
MLFTEYEIVSTEHLPCLYTVREPEPRPRSRPSMLSTVRVQLFKGPVRKGEPLDQPRQKSDRGHTSAIDRTGGYGPELSTLSVVDSLHTVSSFHPCAPRPSATVR